MYIMGKFGRENVWQIYSFQVFGEKTLAKEQIGQKVSKYVLTAVFG